MIPVKLIERLRTSQAKISGLLIIFAFLMLIGFLIVECTLKQDVRMCYMWVPSIALLIALGGTFLEIDRLNWEKKIHGY